MNNKNLNNLYARLDYAGMLDSKSKVVNWINQFNQLDFAYYGCDVDSIIHYIFNKINEEWADIFKSTADKMIHQLLTREQLDFCEYNKEDWLKAASINHIETLTDIITAATNEARLIYNQYQVKLIHFKTKNTNKI